MALKKPDFQWRGLISYLLFFSFFLAAFSGVALYLRPEGSLARWMGWRFFGLDKKNWEAIHTAAVVLAVAAAVAHNWYNRRVLWGSFRRLPGKLWSARKEVFVAFLLVIIFSLAAFYQLPPVSLLSDWRSGIKNGKNSLIAVPPVPDAERLPLAKLAAKGGFSFERFLSKLRGLGMKNIPNDATLEDLSGKLNRSPQQLYLVLTAE